MFSKGYPPFTKKQSNLTKREIQDMFMKFNKIRHILGRSNFSFVLSTFLVDIHGLFLWKTKKTKWALKIFKQNCNYSDSKLNQTKHG